MEGFARSSLRTAGLCSILRWNTCPPFTVTDSQGAAWSVSAGLAAAASAPDDNKLPNWRPPSSSPRRKTTARVSKP